jgi:hypothetical protein
MIYLLIGGLEHGLDLTFHSVGNGIIIPTDELIFFRGIETTWKDLGIIYCGKIQWKRLSIKILTERIWESTLW